MFVGYILKYELLFLQNKNSRIEWHMLDTCTTNIKSAGRTRRLETGTRINEMIECTGK